MTHALSLSVFIAFKGADFYIFIYDSLFILCSVIFLTKNKIVLMMQPKCDLKVQLRFDQSSHGVNIRVLRSRIARFSIGQNISVYCIVYVLREW